MTEHDIELEKEEKKGFEARCDSKFKFCKLCKSPVEAPCHICLSGLRGFLCKKCEPPIEYYDMYTGKGKKFLTTLAADNPNLPRFLNTSTSIHIERFRCGCSHVDASDGATTIIETPVHPRVNTINGKAVIHTFDKPNEHIQPETIFKEIDDKQTEGEPQGTISKETI